MAPTLLAQATRFLFFTGKGGVGKTSLAAATAVAFADAGFRVLLVSTDAASNLDEVLGAPLATEPTRLPSLPLLSVMNIDPNAAAEAYRERADAQLGDASYAVRARQREQLSGACTTEVATFDAFAGLLATADARFTYVIFDTAPTGHTLRLLSLPAAWSGFLERNDAGASCLGPHGGLTQRHEQFRAALAVLVDAAKTTVVLVAKPDVRSLEEAERAAHELSALGLGHQRLVINGVFRSQATDDEVGRALERDCVTALAHIPPALAALPCDALPLLPIDTVGLDSLRALFGGPMPPAPPRHSGALAHQPGLGSLVDDLAAVGRGLVMVMGKGGVGKTTIACALAIGLVRRGHDVLLTTTDPAAHVTQTLNGSLERLRVSRIDPVAETERYVELQLAARGKGLSPAELDLLREDLASPCSEEVAVFHAFSRIVSESRSSFVVLDTAPTGHALLLMDATGAYHRQTVREQDARGRPLSFVTPLMRLQDAALTHVVVVTLPEATPVSQAAALQAELRRAHIEPWAWVANRCLSATTTHEPVLAARLQQERVQLARIEAGLAKRLVVVPWQVVNPVGLAALTSLVSSNGAAD